MRVGIFDGETDIGHVSRPGTLSFDPALEHYRVAGSGQNMWNDRDDFHFVWKRMTGNFILSARARFVGDGVGGASQDRLDHSAHAGDERPARHRRGARRMG